MLLELIGRATLVTPNLLEAERLCECDVSTREGVEAAATALVNELGARAALIKGGHRDGPPDDLLALREGGSAALRWLSGVRVDAGPVHGTGCALAAAITAQLARGAALPDAVEAGRRFVAEALARSAAEGRRGRLLVF